MKFYALSAALYACLVGIRVGQSSFSPVRPPAIPLAVRSPYVSTWQTAGSDGGNGGYLAGEWPSFWANQTTGWTGLIRVDNTVYTWMGAPVGPQLVNQTAFQYTSTKSIFTMNVAGLVQMNITFFSPITPSDFMRQSLTFSYMNVDVTSLDGVNHHVELYTDMTAEWVSGDRSAIAQWDYNVTSGNTPAPPPTAAIGGQGVVNNAQARLAEKVVATTIHSIVSGTKPVALSTTNTITYTTPLAPAPSPKVRDTAPTHAPGGLAYHRFYRQTQLAFSEVADQSEYGYWYYATDNIANLTHQSGADVDVRAQFITNGFLNNTEDTFYRAIQANYPVFGFTVDLGAVNTTTIDTLFSLGLAQQEAIQFDGATGNVSVPSLWTSFFADDVAALSFFHTDYATASGADGSFDNQLASDSLGAGGQSFLTITSLAARQAFGATILAGTSNKTYLFLKEISSDGNVQTVDVIFPFHPVLSYTNATLLKFLLDPLFENQESGQYPNKYSMHDLGTHYPNATGHALGNDEMQPLEECGNMLIMTLAYSQKANDTGYLTQHYGILNQWTQYLIEDALIPMNQISTDDFAGPLANQTNLALKGIIGIGAMAVIANETGNTADGLNYTNVAHSYISQWQSFAVANTTPPHTTLNYGNTTSHSLLYNLYADAELNLQLVPRSIYDMQSAFYPTVEQTYGVPLDTRHNYTEPEWEMFAAAVASNTTQQMLIGDLAKWIGQTPTNRAFTDLFDAITGDYPGDMSFTARPVIGGVFALLALKGEKVNVA